jgi:hypothetical protein
MSSMKMRPSCIGSTAMASSTSLRAVTSGSAKGPIRDELHAAAFLVRLFARKIGVTRAALRSAGHFFSGNSLVKLTEPIFELPVPIAVTVIL